MDKEKIVEYRGIRNLVAAKLIKDTQNELTYDAPFRLAGVSELTRETEASSETHYYDDVPAVVVNATGADTVNVNTSVVSVKNTAKITGQKYDEGTGMLIEGESYPEYMAIGYITEDTDKNKYYVWRLKGKFSIPSDSHASKSDSADAQGQELTYTGIMTEKTFRKNDGKGARAVVVPAATCRYTEEEFFSSVKTPDDIGEKEEGNSETEPVG